MGAVRLRAVRGGTAWYFSRRNLVRRREAGRLATQCEYSFEDMDVLRLLEGIELGRGRVAERVRTVRIFLASSSELREDRDAFDLYFRQLNDELRREGLYLEIVRWENFLVQSLPPQLEIILENTNRKRRDSSEDEARKDPRRPHPHHAPAQLNPLQQPQHIHILKAVFALRRQPTRLPPPHQIPPRKIPGRPARALARACRLFIPQPLKRIVQSIQSAETTLNSNFSGPRPRISRSHCPKPARPPHLRPIPFKQHPAPPSHIRIAHIAVQSTTESTVIIPFGRKS